jgi:hypothetical protein
MRKKPWPSAYTSTAPFVQDYQKCFCAVGGLSLWSFRASSRALLRPTINISRPSRATAHEPARFTLFPSALAYLEVGPGGSIMAGTAISCTMSAMEPFVAFMLQVLAAIVFVFMDCKRAPASLVSNVEADCSCAVGNNSTPACSMSTKRLRGACSGLNPVPVAVDCKLAKTSKGARVAVSRWDLQRQRRLWHQILQGFHGGLIVAYVVRSYHHQHIIPRHLRGTMCPYHVHIHVYKCVYVLCVAFPHAWKHGLIACMHACQRK